MAPPPCRPMVTSYPFVTISNSRMAASETVYGPLPTCPPPSWLRALTPSTRTSVDVVRAPPMLKPLPLVVGASSARSVNCLFWTGSSAISSCEILVLAPSRARRAPVATSTRTTCASSCCTAGSSRNVSSARSPCVRRKPSCTCARNPRRRTETRYGPPSGRCRKMKRPLVRDVPAAV